MIINTVLRIDLTGGRLYIILRVVFMCGRYAFFDEQEVYEARKILEDIALTFGGEKVKSIKKGDIFPSDTAPLLCQTDNRPAADALKWGYVFRGQKRLIINARSESLFEKPLFLKSVRNKKCLIPANVFYEWEAGGTGKIKRVIGVKGEQLFYMCGLYSDFNIEGTNEKRFLIITKPANAQMLPIHNRMPLIAPKNMANDWLAEKDSVDKLVDKLVKTEIYLNIA